MVKNKKLVTLSLSVEQIQTLKRLSSETAVPQSRIVGWLLDNKASDLSEAELDEISLSLKFLKDRL